MSRAPQTFKQGDVTKAVKGAVNAGLVVSRVEVGKDGKITVFTDPVLAASPANEWDAIR